MHAGVCVGLSTSIGNEETNWLCDVDLLGLRLERINEVNKWSTREKVLVSFLYFLII